MHTHTHIFTAWWTSWKRQKCNITPPLSQMKDWPWAGTQSAMYSLEHKEQNALNATVSNLVSNTHCWMTLSSLAVIPQVRDNVVVHWQTVPRSSKFCPPYLLCWKEFKSTLPPNAGPQPMMNTVWGFLGGNTRAAACIKLIGFASAEEETNGENRRKWEKQSWEWSKDKAETKVLRTQNWLCGKKKKTNQKRKLVKRNFFSNFAYDEVDRILCCLSSWISPKVILHSCQPLPKGCNSTES